MNFASDNVYGVDEAVIEAIAAANRDTARSYGADDYSSRAENMLKDIFECDLRAFLVATGTAANALSLSAICPPYGAVLCHAGAHVMIDECGAPEFYTAGAKLMGIHDPAGKILPQSVSDVLAGFVGGEHDPKPSALSLTNATELGTVYTPAEVAELAAAIAPKNMKLHMDGARFANALVAAGCSAAELTWKSGVDVMSFGATKNGAMALEAVIFFDTALAGDFAYRRMRAGHLLSKGRFLGAQMAAYLAGGRWLDNARHANAMAARLAAGAQKLAGMRIAVPVAANEVFIIMERAGHDRLQKAGAVYYEWPGPGPKTDNPGQTEVLARFVTSFKTTARQVDDFLALAAAQDTGTQ